VKSVADVTIDIDANLGNTSATIQDATNSLDGLGDAANSASGDWSNAGSEAQGFGGRMDMMGAGALGASAAFADLGGVVQQAADLWNLGEQRADDLTRAQNDVAQAALDVTQANQDMKQSQIDANQAQIDGVQSGIDLKQALLDQKKAQKDYNDAVKEFGPKSLEAQQAQIDLSQADADAKQAKLDGKQATEDYKQATIDGKQATIDASNAQLDLNEAQRNVVGAGVMGSWVGTVSTVASAVFGLVGTFALLGGGMIATAATAVVTAVTTAGAWLVAWVTMAAAATANAIRMAAAWLLSIWPIALIIAAIAGLVYVFIKYWAQIRDFTIKVFTYVWIWLRGQWNQIVAMLKLAITAIKYVFFRFVPLGIIIRNWGAITGWVSRQWAGITKNVSSAVAKIGSFFGGMWDGITTGLRGALNGAIGLINGAIGGINSLISGANRIPGVNIPFVPYIPYLAQGGVTTGPTLAMIGEGHEQEAVLPLSKLQGMMNASGGNGSQTVVWELRGGSKAFREFLQESVRNVAGGSVVKFAEG
jgi:hypothetical protein